MSYLNEDWITDTHVADIIEREDVSEQIKRLDYDIEAACIAKNVQPADIPVDEAGYLTSGSLIQYAIFSLYVTILSDYWGGGMGETADIYFAKLEYYTKERNNAKSALTTENILGTPMDAASYIKQVPVY